MICLTTGLCLPPIRWPAVGVCHSGHFRHLIGTANGCRINVDSNDMLNVGVLKLPNFGTFWHQCSSLWSTWATWVQIMSSNLVEHRTTDLVICHMPRFLKLDDFCPIWTRFLSLWATLQISVEFVFLIFVEHCMTDLLMCHMPRFLKLNVRFLSRLAKFIVTLVNMDNLSPTFAIDPCRAP